MNIFERAARRKLRFDTSRGAVTVEDLFDIPLRSKNEFSLDAIAKSVSKVLKDEAEQSFVDAAPSASSTELELKLEVLKHIIAAKLADEAAVKARAEKAAKRAKILEALARKEDQSIDAMSQEDLLAQLQALDA
jgi:hypothetical protein